MIENEDKAEAQIGVLRSTSRGRHWYVIGGSGPTLGKYNHFKDAMERALSLALPENITVTD